MSGSVRPLVGSRPMFTPMLMSACKPIQMPMPCAASAAKWRSRSVAWRPMAKARAHDPDEQRDDQRPRRRSPAPRRSPRAGNRCAPRAGRCSFSTLAPEADAEPLAAAEGDQRVRQLVAACRRRRTTGSMKPKMRCMRYGEDTISDDEADGEHARPGRRSAAPFMPPRNRMPNAVTAITTNAPKSGSRSSSHDDEQHHARASAAGPCLKLFMHARACAPCSRRRRAPRPAS